MNHFPYLGGTGCGNTGCKLTQEPTANRQQIRNSWQRNWRNQGLQTHWTSIRQAAAPSAFCLWPALYYLLGTF